VLRDFWKTRRGISVNGSTGSRRHENYVGVQAQLQGLLSSTIALDENKFLSLCSKPLLVVHSTENIFVNPRLAESLSSRELLSENRFLAEGLENALRFGAVHVSWLRAGHELLQERPAYLLSLVSSLAQQCSVAPLREVVDATDDLGLMDDPDETIDQFDTVVNGEIGPDLSSRTETNGSKEGREEIEAMDALEQVDVGDTEEVEHAESDTESEEKERRKLRKLERLQRIRKAERAAELDYYYALQRREKTLARETAEARAMNGEDARSRLAEDFVLYCVAIELSASLAKEKADELRLLRRNEAIRQVEDQLARQRAERVEERRRKADSLLKAIESESMMLEGEAGEGYEPKGQQTVNSLIDATRRLFGDYLECRQKSIYSLQRHMTMEAKMATFREHSAMLQGEVRKMRRAVRLAETNPTLVVGQHSVVEQMHKLRGMLATKEQSYSEFTTISQSREAQLTAASRNFRSFKLKLCGLETLMSDRLRDLCALEGLQEERVKLQCGDKEELNNIGRELLYRKTVAARRKDALSKELARIRDVKDKFVDTDLWIEGVLQRCVTKELRRHLKREHDVAEEARIKSEAEHSMNRAAMLELEELIMVSSAQTRTMQTHLTDTCACI
jgi:hypothetical protein